MDPRMFLETEEERLAYDRMVAKRTGASRAKPASSLFQGFGPGQPLPQDAVLGDQEVGSSYDRYLARVSKFDASHEAYPRVRHHLFWVLHNCVAHPILAFYPEKEAVEFHQLTSRWLNQSDHVRLAIPVPEVKDKKSWVRHNLWAHLLIGVFPVKEAFDYHDETAKSMAVRGWV